MSDYVVVGAIMLAFGIGVSVGGWAYSSLSGIFAKLSKRCESQSAQCYWDTPVDDVYCAKHGGPATKCPVYQPHMNGKGSKTTSRTMWD